MNKLSIQSNQCEDNLNTTTDSVYSSILNSSFTPDNVTSKSTSTEEKKTKKRSNERCYI